MFRMKAFFVLDTRFTYNGISSKHHIPEIRQFSDPFSLNLEKKLSITFSLSRPGRGRAPESASKTMTFGSSSVKAGH
jgi:hypothetical protein